jgi:hypothetical protein
LICVMPCMARCLDLIGVRWLLRFYIDSIVSACLL